MLTCFFHSRLGPNSLFLSNNSFKCKECCTCQDQVNVIVEQMGYRLMTYGPMTVQNSVGYSLHILKGCMTYNINTRHIFTDNKTVGHDLYVCNIKILLPIDIHFPQRTTGWERVAKSIAREHFCQYNKTQQGPLWSIA